MTRNNLLQLFRKNATTIVSLVGMDYFDQLKSRTKGYASLDYDFDTYKPSKLVKLDILLSGKPIDALSFIVHTDKACRYQNRSQAKHSL